MSTPFYDLASLVVVPSGYKASKVYAQKPLTTDGQLTFSRASTATRVNSAGLIETVSSNVPRLDYLGSTCPKLLLEPQRTNSMLYSEDLTSLSIQGVGTVSANAATAPDGTTTADKWTVTTTSTYAGVVVSGMGNNTYTVSMFAKAAGKNWVFLFNIGSAGGVNGTWFNVSNGTIGTVGAAWSNAKIENYGNGWYRVSATVTLAGGNFLYWLSADSDASITTTANGTDGVLMWGLSYEVGSYLTSYIKTTTAAVTRLADACSKTGISSLIGQTEGTIFFEVDKTARTDNDYRVQLSDGTTNNWLFASIEVGNSVRLYCNVGGVNQFSIFQGTLLTNGRHKIAAAYKANDFKLYVDGVAAITQTSGSVPTCSRFDIGSSSPNGTAGTESKTSQALLFKTRLTNAQLAELTTL